jgi:uncharacterized protein
MLHKRWSLFIMLFVSVCLLQAQTETTGSVLWEITGKGLKQPSYLFGTIHIQDKRVFNYGETVEKALYSCNAFAMELLMGNIKKEELEAQMLMKDKSLQELYSAEDYELLKKIFKEKTGTALMIFQKTKPFFVSAQLMQANMRQDMPLALDMHLLKLAADTGMLTFGIEEFADQMGAVDKISLEDQAKMLLESVKDTTGSEEQFDDLLQTYLSGNLEKMLELSADSSMPKEFNEYFLVKRNYKMAKVIGKLIKKQPTFNAIGAAHLGGKEGVIHLLRKKGFTVRPVFFERPK